MSRIIDVSSYNGNVDWALCKEKGVDGAILKIIRKNLLKDNQFDRNHKQCNKNGIPWDVYNYTYATTMSKAKSDMRRICDILDACNKSYFNGTIWFDVEDSAQAKLSKMQIADICNAAYDVVKSRGYDFGIYTGMAFLAEHFKRSEIICEKYWIARYYKGCIRMNIKDAPNASYKPPHPSNLFAWQYTSHGYIGPKAGSGNGNNFDLSITYRDFTSKKVARLYQGAWPVMPERGYYQQGDGITTLTDHPTNIKRVQKVVNWYCKEKVKGYKSLIIDGKYGKKTAEAVRLCQKSLGGLDVNGQFGNKTMSKLKKVKL